MAKIDTKFGLDDEVFTFEKTENDEILINRGKITEMCIDKDGVGYYIDDIFVEYSEDKLIDACCDPDDLYIKLYELTEKNNGPETTQRN